MNTEHKSDNHFQINPAQNQYHGLYYWPPTTISVGSDGGRAQTTGTVPQTAQHGYDGVQAPTACSIWIWCPSSNMSSTCKLQS